MLSDAPWRSGRSDRARLSLSDVHSCVIRQIRTRRGLYSPTRRQFCDNVERVRMAKLASSRPCGCNSVACFAPEGLGVGRSGLPCRPQNTSHVQIEVEGRRTRRAVTWLGWPSPRRRARSAFVEKEGGSMETCGTAPPFATASLSPPPSGAHLYPKPRHGFANPVATVFTVGCEVSELRSWRLGPSDKRWNGEAAPWTRELHFGSEAVHPEATQPHESSYHGSTRRRESAERSTG